VKQSAPLPTRGAYPLSAQFNGTNCAKKFTVAVEKICVFSACFNLRKTYKIELRAAP